MRIIYGLIALQLFSGLEGANAAPVTTEVLSRFCWQFPPGQMAGSSSQLSAAVKELLAKVKDEGSVHELLNELIQYEHGEFELVSESGYQHGGSMNDSSKRRLNPSPSRSPELSQLPLAKAKAKSSGVTRQLELPQGVVSLQHWGQTLIECGKLSKRGMSYEELATSSDTELISYTRWLIGQKDRTNLSAPVKDLVMYLSAHAEAFESAEDRFPNSTVPRRFKS